MITFLYNVISRCSKYIFMNRFFRKLINIQEVSTRNSFSYGRSMNVRDVVKMYTTFSENDVSKDIPGDIMPPLFPEENKESEDRKKRRIEKEHMREEINIREKNVIIHETNEDKEIEKNIDTEDIQNKKERKKYNPHIRRKNYLQLLNFLENTYNSNTTYEMKHESKTKELLYQIGIQTQKTIQQKECGKEVLKDPLLFQIAKGCWVRLIRTGKALSDSSSFAEYSEDDLQFFNGMEFFYQEQ